MAIFDEPSRKPLPQPTFEDVVHAGRKALVSMIPLVGGAGTELMELMSSPVSIRRDEWFEDLARRLKDLEQTIDGFHFEELANSEQFVSSLLQATQAAVKTHHPAKLAALRNAVLNTAIGCSVDDVEQATFLGYIDELSTWHLQILLFLQNPLKLVNERKVRTDYSMGSLARPLEEVFPELRGRQDFYDQILRDLRSRGFVNSAESLFQSTMTTSGMFAKRTTEIGDRFLEFIKSPETEKKP